MSPEIVPFMECYITVNLGHMENGLFPLPLLLWFSSSPECYETHAMLDKDVDSQSYKICFSKL